MPFPRLFRLNQSHEASIASVYCDCPTQVGWNFNFFRALNDGEVSELLSLLTILQPSSLMPGWEIKEFRSLIFLVAFLANPTSMP